MNTQYQNKFSVRLDDDADGNMRLSLGTKFPAIYVSKNGNIFKESENHTFEITAAEHEKKPWIRKCFISEIAFQKRKSRAIMFSKPCFQREHYSANQRIAYNNAKFNGGAR